MVAGVVWLLAATAMAVWPDPTSAVLAWLFGGALLAGGVVELVMFARLPVALCCV
ncbi:MAG: hypothetical protein EA387_14305 [Nitriliruptor sp.]|nr:MAG: hypothetical protein EA387_14305 [Nitriliruptor sp.]